MEVKLTAPSSDPQFVTGLGSLVPGEWTEISDEQVQLFEALHKTKISKVKFLEVKKASKKKEDE